MESILIHLDVSEYEKIAPIYDQALKENDYDILLAIDALCQRDQEPEPPELLTKPFQFSMWEETDLFSLNDTEEIR